MRFVQDLAEYGMRILERIEAGIREPGLGVFLADQGARIGEPTVLDKFIDRVYPSHNPPLT